MRLKLGQIEIWPCAARNQFLRIVKKIHGKIEDAAGHGFAVHPHMAFLEVPAPHPHEQHRRTFLQRVVLAGVLVVESDRTTHGMAQI